ncbi:Acetylgalactosaminyl-O-glycosyl-glycoprotein beta-1,3-N-acetylglucosaminyltransferase, partial [Eschrichtius robustus]|nr:Acetylgalactosaminyl-O-glycosyl-glycoprotein beta-1,3-N-acetylglucosaminyltransferase [Eschrichtius robustus]
MAFPRRRAVKPKTLTCLLVGLSFLGLHLWFLKAKSQQERMSDGSPQIARVAPVAAPPSSPGPQCLANASANATANFERLATCIQDFLRYLHCRHFPLLWDAPAKCAGGRGTFLLLAERSYGGRTGRRLFRLGAAAREDAERAEGLAAVVALEARDHGGVLQEASADTFLNLTLKHVHLIHWLEARCLHARFLLSGGDDVLVHTANVLRFL